MAEPTNAGDCNPNVESTEEEEHGGDEIAADSILNCPDVLAALQGRLHAEMLASLPPAVKRRIKALKKLQLQATHIEAKFFEEVHALECKYHKLYSPIYEKRAQIVSGIYEPNEEECDWVSDDEDVSADVKNKLKIEDVDSNKKDDAVKEEEKNAKNENVSGIPDFWLTIFKNVTMLSEMVQEHDEPIMKHLIDIKVLFLPADPMGFVLEFHFSPNEYFSNSVLTKEYEMKCVPDPEDPFCFEGPEIFTCKGCVIDWKKGKNVTLKTVKKKQKHKQRGLVRTVTKVVQTESFFNFFSPPSVPEDPNADLDDETKTLLTSDFEIGHYIRERIVPRAVLYYTGEGIEEEDYEEEEEEEEHEESDDDDDDSGSPDSKQKNCQQQ